MRPNEDRACQVSRVTKNAWKLYTSTHIPVYALENQRFIEMLVPISRLLDQLVRHLALQFHNQSQHVIVRATRKEDPANDDDRGRVSDDSRKETESSESRAAGRRRPPTFRYTARTMCSQSTTYPASSRTAVPELEASSQKRKIHSLVKSSPKKGKRRKRNGDDALISGAR